MLWEAARKGRLDVVRFLLKKGADINVAACYYSDNFVDISAYCVAKANGRDAVADLLRNEGAVIDTYTHCYLGNDIDMPNWIGFPALVDESRGNHNMPDDPDRVIALLDKGANVNVTDHKGKTALHRAAQAGFLKITEILIERGADVEARDEQGETPLFDAVRSARNVTVRLLMQHGASVTTRNFRGQNVMDIATSTRKPEIRSMARILRDGNP